MSRQPSPQKTARARLLALYKENRSWRKVGGVVGINCGQAWKLAHGRQKASREILRRLGVELLPKRRIPWKKKYRLLRMAIDQRRVP